MSNLEEFRLEVQRMYVDIVKQHLDIKKSFSNKRD